MNMRIKNIAVCVTFALIITGGFFLCICMPKAEYSNTERRGLAPMPQLSKDAVASGRFMSGFEQYAVDHFPFRDTFRTVNALTAGGIFRRQDYHGLYVSDGYIAAVEYPMNEESFIHAAGRFRYIFDKYLNDQNHVFLSVIPDKNCFLAKESGHLSMDYAEFESRMSGLTDFAQYIRISDLLERDDYYKTDTHWRQEKIIDVADRLAAVMSNENRADDKIDRSDSKAYDKEYDPGAGTDRAIHTLDHDFYGVYYGQAALPLAPDRLRYVTDGDIDGCSVYDWEHKKEIPVYDLALAAGRDPYEMFLSGSLSLITMENPKAQTDKKLVVFRDSFGSSIAPLLIGSYSQITLADLRLIHPDQLGKFIDFSSSDVLFLYSTLVLNHSDTIR